MRAPAELVALCHAVAARGIVWTQGAGGNVSLKAPGAGRLWIKASGARLDAVRPEVGVAEVDCAAVAAWLRGRGADGDGDAAEGAYAAALAAARLPGGGRPSMETGLHVALGARVVLHFHSLVAMLMAHVARRAPGRWAAWRARSAAAPQLVPPALPGRALSAALAAAPPAACYVLENHGVVLCGDDGRCLRAWEASEMDFCRHFGFGRLAALLAAPPGAARRRALAAAAVPLRLAFPDLAVFVGALSPHLTGHRGAGAEGWVGLRPEAWRVQPDAAELWLAWALLHREAPDFASLPAALAAALPHLPAERFRRRAVAGRRPPMAAAAGEGPPHGR